MPQMGESVTEGTILEWHVSEGQEVAEGDTVVEVSTDKIDAEVPAPASGVVTKILAAPDDVVEVGQVLAQIDPNGTATNGGDPSPLHEQDGLVMGGGEGDEDLGDDDVPSESSQPGEIEVARARDPPPGGKRGRGRNVGNALDARDGRVGHRGDDPRVACLRGPDVAEGDTVIEVSTDKIDAEVPAPVAGTVTKLLVNPDDTVQVGQALAEMTAGSDNRRAARLLGFASGGGRVSRGTGLQRCDY